MKPARVRQLIRKWQRILRLEDWDITYDPDRKPDEENTAECHYQSTSYMVTILCSDEATERDIIHELLHIYCVDWDHLDLHTAKAWIRDEGASELFAALGSIIEERLINKLAGVLLALDRGGEANG